MDKYEYRVKTEQLLEYTEKKQYRKAMEIADTIDWRRVKSASMLNTVSEVYEYCGEFQKSRDILFMAFDRSPGSRKIVYRLATLALKVNDPDEASDCYEEFVKLAPKDPNQYILKYRILKVQRAPVEEQIAALEEFKKAEYIEKWAYELAKLYHDAGMVRECLEECDDLILWFSEGKYVYLAMELKMKYKPLTPLQQEKYDKHTGKKTKDIVIPGQEEEDEEEDKTETANGNTQEIPPLKEEAAAEKEEVEEKTVPKQTPAEEKEDVKEDVKEAEEEKSKPRATITRIVTGATLEEALASGVAMAAGLNQEEKAMAERDEELKISGQMKIEDILQEWEEKQKVNADAIEKQKAEDKERLRIERQEAEKRKEASRKAAEEAARKAEEEARKKAAEEAARKAEEEARKKAEEEAARKEAEETARKAEEAAKKAEEARKKAAEEAEKLAASQTAAKKKAKGAATSAPKSKKTKKNILEEKTQKLPDDIMELVEQLESRVSGTASPQKEEEEEFEQEDLLEALAEDFGEGEPAVLLEAELQADESEEENDLKEEEPEENLPEEEESEGDFEEDDFEEKEPEGEDVGEEAPENDESEDDFEEESEDDFGDEESEDFEENDFDDESEEDFEEDDFDDESEDFEEDDFDDESEEGFEEDDFDDDESEEDFEEDDFDDESEEDFEEDFEEDDFDDESEEDFEEDDFDDESEEDFEEDEFGEEGDFDEDEFDEDEFIESEDDFDEEDFDEDDFEEEDFEDGESEDEDDFDEDELDEDELDEEDFEEEEEEEISLEIEEPSEEEIQKRFKKAKGGGGVPFDTGFVVTGRYDLSATSEIGLKAGLTEEQKKLFSYFVPVRGMSEQIVEALDNDRRAQREGTSKTGNLLVIGRKGSGKTVLAVDIVKAIQKQRNLKQGKVAIVTGESLNKKELPNIIQKLKGGAIIVEKAGKLNSRTVKELNHLMERKTGEMLFVLEDQRKPLEKVLTANPEFKKKFTSKLELPIFINDELVTFGQTYAKENGYKLDEMGILALYSRIDVMQREDHAVSVAEVKEIMDEAISHSQRVNVKHLARRVFGKGTDDSDRIILKEEDFKI